MILGVSFCESVVGFDIDCSECQSKMSPMSLAVSSPLPVGVSRIFALGFDVLMGECTLPSGWRICLMSVLAVVLISCLSSVVDVRYAVVRSFSSVWNSGSVFELTLAMNAPADSAVLRTRFRVGFVHFPCSVRVHPPIVVAVGLVDDVGALRFRGVL